MQAKSVDLGIKKQAKKRELIMENSLTNQSFTGIYTQKFYSATQNTDLKIQNQTTGIIHQKSSLSELAERWLNDSDTKASTKYIYSYCIKYFIEYANKENIDPTIMSHDAITRYKAYLREVLPSDNSQALYLRAVKSFFKWFGRNGGMDAGAGVKANSVDLFYRKDPITFEEYERILGEIDLTSLTGQRDYVIVKVMYATGMRCMSAIDIKWGNFTTIEGTPAIKYATKGKGNATGVAPLTKKILSTLERYKVIMDKNSAPTGPDGYIFPVIGDDWRKMTYKNLYLRLVDYMTKAGVYDKFKKTPHSFRHGAATNILEKTKDKNLCKLMLGHINSRSSDIYVAQMERRESMAKLNDIGL